MDEDQLGALIEMIYTSAFEEGGWDALLQTLRMQFRAAEASMVAFDGVEGCPPFTSSTLDAESLKPYSAYFHMLDPVFPANHWKIQKKPEHPGGFPIEAIMERTDWINSEFYCDFIRRCDMGLPLTSILHQTEQAFAYFVVHRPVPGEDYDEEEINLLRTLAPHLNRGLRIYRELTGARAKAGLFETAIDMLAATFQLDHAGRVLSLNKKAETLLCENSPLTVLNGRLAARHPPDNARLAAALVPPAPGAPPPELVLRGPACCHSVQLTITPVNGSAIPLFFDATHTARVALLVTAVPLGPSIQSLIARFGLTQAEAEITLLLLEGAKAPQIALHRDTSTGTVNSQIKHIYAKTGADGHAGLLVLLLGR